MVTQESKYQVTIRGIEHYKQMENVYGELALQLLLGRLINIARPSNQPPSENLKIYRPVGPVPLSELKEISVNAYSLMEELRKNGEVERDTST